MCSDISYLATPLQTPWTTAIPHTWNPQFHANCSVLSLWQMGWTKKVFVNDDVEWALRRWTFISHVSMGSHLGSPSFVSNKLCISWRCWKWFLTSVNTIWIDGHCASLACDKMWNKLQWQVIQLSGAGQDELHTQFSFKSFSTAQAIIQRNGTLSFLAVRMHCLVLLFRSLMHISWG